MKKRIFSFFMVLTLILPCFAVPTSAVQALPGGVAAGATGLIQSPALAASAKEVVGQIAGYLGADDEAVAAILSYLVSVTGYGNLGHDGLQSACNRLNQISANPDKYAKRMYEDCISIGYDAFPVDFEIFYKIFVYWTAYQNDLVDGWHIIDHPDYGYVIVNQPETFILADSVGRYPYAQEITDKWLGSRTALEASTVHLLTDYSMKDLQAVHETLHPDWSFRRTNVTLYDGKYTVLQAASDGIHYDQILCDELGFPYGIPQGNTQMGSDRDYNNDKEGQPEVSDEPIVDIDGDLVMQMFPDGSFTWINNLLYDASEKTYYLDSSATYNTTNNYTYNYEWNYTYHINYTSITYIGQTEEYNEKYEYYFDLPDGRSSADLTAEELQALNTQIDVLPYVRSADDVSIRALYHFDGNTRDSSYWSHIGNFKWNSGATLTYMDVGAFNGALYLSEQEHDFSITLPGNLGTGDWTVQFRYYQSATPAPAADSKVLIGGFEALGFNGSALTSYSGATTYAAMSPGVWNEICIMRSGGTVYRFLNGVLVSTFSNSSTLSNVINFHFGAEQQTYKYFDELRVVNKALYDTAGYTCSSVPFDTNLTLVLPDSQLPVADAYWIFDSSKTNILSDLGLANYVDFYSSNCYSSSSSPSRSSYAGEYGYTNMVFRGSNPSGLVSFYNSYLTPFTTSSSGSYFGAVNRSISGLSLTTKKVKAYRDSSANSNADYVVPYSYSFYAFLAGTGDFNALKANTSYTFSMVSSTGEVGSLTFKTPSSWSGSTFSDSFKTKTFNGYQLFYSLATTDGYLNTASFGLRPSAFGDAGEFVYLELVEGTSTDLSAEYIESVVVMDKDDLNTPSLAVRTDLDITGYQIGGVRPSLPEKGLVWALVESGRINSLQIYDGQAWEQVDGRIWTGSRWVPYYAYDVLLLKDLWDIVESDPTLDFIYTEEGFWKWLQDAWGDMMEKLDQIAAGSGGSGGSGSTDTRSFWDKVTDAFTSGLSALIEGVFSLITEILKTLLSLVTDMLSFLFSFIGETVLGGIGDFFSAFTDGSLLDGFQHTDETGNTTTQLPEGVGAVFADISGMISALPAELLGVLVIGIALLFLLGVIMLIV